MNYPIEQCMVGILDNPALWKQAPCGALWGMFLLSPTITVLRVMILPAAQSYNLSR